MMLYKAFPNQTEGIKSGDFQDDTKNSERNYMI